VELCFSAVATRDELHEVKQILASSPGQQRVQLVFGRPEGEALRVDAGPDFCVDMTRELEQKLARWLVASKAERRPVPAQA
jgi:hypothetical protein